MYGLEPVSDRAKDRVQSSSARSWIWSCLDTEQIMAMMMVIRIEIISSPTSWRQRERESLTACGAITLSFCWVFFYTDSFSSLPLALVDALSCVLILTFLIFCVHCLEKYIKCLETFENIWSGKFSGIIVYAQCLAQWWLCFKSIVNIFHFLLVHIMWENDVELIKKK